MLKNNFLIKVVLLTSVFSFNIYSSEIEDKISEEYKLFTGFNIPHLKVQPCLAVQFVYYLKNRLELQNDRETADKIRSIITYGSGVGGIDMSRQATEDEKKVLFGAVYGTSSYFNDDADVNPDSLISSQELTVRLAYKISKELNEKYYAEKKLLNFESDRESYNVFITTLNNYQKAYDIFEKDFPPKYDPYYLESWAQEFENDSVIAIEEQFKKEIHAIEGYFHQYKRSEAFERSASVACKYFQSKTERNDSVKLHILILETEYKEQLLKELLLRDSMKKLLQILIEKHVDYVPQYLQECRQRLGYISDFKTFTNNYYNNKVDFLDDIFDIFSYSDEITRQYPYLLDIEYKETLSNKKNQYRKKLKYDWYKNQATVCRRDTLNHYITQISSDIKVWGPKDNRVTEESRS